MGPVLSVEVRWRCSAPEEEALAEREAVWHGARALRGNWEPWLQSQLRYELVPGLQEVTETHALAFLRGKKDVLG